MISETTPKHDKTNKHLNYYQKLKHRISLCDNLKTNIHLNCRVNLCVCVCVCVHELINHQINIYLPSLIDSTRNDSNPPLGRAGLPVLLLEPSGKIWVIRTAIIQFKYCMVMSTCMCTIHVHALYRWAIYNCKIFAMLSGTSHNQRITATTCTCTCIIMPVIMRLLSP